MPGQQGGCGTRPGALGARPCGKLLVSVGHTAKPEGRSPLDSHYNLSPGALLFHLFPTPGPTLASRLAAPSFRIRCKQNSQSHRIAPHAVPNLENSPCRIRRRTWTGFWSTYRAEFVPCRISAWPVPNWHAVPNSAWNRDIPCRIRRGPSNSASHVRIRRGIPKRRAQFRRGRFSVNKATN